MIENISEHITYLEATKSEKAIRQGIDNTPNEFQLQNMRMVAEKIFEPTRNHFGVPIYISSFVRVVKLNRSKLVGGAKFSDHEHGEETGDQEGAIDMDADVFGKVTNKQIYDYIKNNLEYDQLIWEFGDDNNPAWVHASYALNNCRMQTLRAYKVEVKPDKFKTVYKPI